MKSLLLFLAIPACTGGERSNSGVCPDGETCSEKTPNGLHFIGNTITDDVVLGGPRPTAVGGTQEVALQYDRGDGILIALDLAYDTDDDGGAGVRVDHTSGSVVTVRGVGAQTNYLRILDAADGTLFDREAMTGSELTSIGLISTDDESVPPGVALAWALGSPTIGVALYGPAQERLVDTSMQVTFADLDGSTRKTWDSFQLPTVTAGTYSLAITAGDKPTSNSDLVVVDAADTVVALDPPTTVPSNMSTPVCFGAMASSRYVVGLSWSFEVDGTSYTQGDGAVTRNCIMVSTPKVAGDVVVQASAGGQHATLTLPVGASGRIAPHRTISRRVTAGERAAM